MKQSDGRPECGFDSDDPLLLIERISELVVMIDPEDADSPAVLVSLLSELADRLGRSGHSLCGSISRTTAVLIEASAKGAHYPGTVFSCSLPKALEIAASAVSGLQAIVRDGRDPEQVYLPGELLALGEPQARIQNDTGKNSSALTSSQPLEDQHSQIARQETIEPGQGNHDVQPPDATTLKEAATLSSDTLVRNVPADKTGAKPASHEPSNVAVPPPSTTSIAGRYLVFSLAGEKYGIEILKIQEIIQLMDITRLPRMPSFVRGVLNLRGKVIPVVDLRMKFGLDCVAATDKTCIIVVQVTHESSKVTIGVIVDEVCEVLDVGADQIENVPGFGLSIKTNFLLGIGKSGSQVVMLLNVDHVLSRSELTGQSQ